LSTGSPLTFSGVLIELPGTIWFLVLLGLETAVHRSTPEAQSRRRVYLFAWLTVGLALTILAGLNVRASSVRNWQYWVAGSAILLSLLHVSRDTLAGARSTFAGLSRDLRTMPRSGGAWLVLGSCVALGALGPSSSSVPSRRIAPLTGSDLLAWFVAQPRHSMAFPGYPSTAVVVATVVDYQCPGSLAARLRMQPVLDELVRTHGSRLRVVTVDFPLESECNAPSGEVADLHPAACEAAAAVRLARAFGRASEMEDWLWTNQQTLSPDLVFQGVADLLGVRLEERYAEMLAGIRTDVALAQQLGVRATPRYLINGVLVNAVRPTDLRTLILKELSIAKEASN
jgi:hypothetical protein